MSTFAAFVLKECYHILRDQRTMLILLVMPIIQILLFGFAITTEVKDVRVAVYDPSRDATTQMIRERFQASPYFTIEEELRAPREINEVFKSGTVNMVLVFGERFTERLLTPGEASIQLIVDGTDPNQASLLTAYAMGILTSCQEELAGAGGLPLRIAPQVQMLYNPQGKSAYNFVPGVMGLILMLICAMMTSVAIVREREQGTMEILLSSPVRPLYIILAKATPYFLLSLVNVCTILLLSVYVLGVPIAGSLSLLLGASVLFSFLSLSLGLLISTLVRTQMAAMLASGMGLMMPVMLLSGMVFPIESMPRVLQWLSAIVPARWYIEAVKKIMIQGVELPYVLPELGILTVMTLSFVLLSLKNFKTRLA